MDKKYIEWGKFEGNLVIMLRDNDNDKNPFRFGLVKAKLFLKHLDKIQEFVNEGRSEPIILMKDETDRFPFTLRLRPAGLILRYLKEIQEFVNEGRAPKSDIVNFSYLFGIAAFEDVSTEDKAKLVALKAYILGAVPCNINEKATFVEIAEQANCKISVGTGTDSLYKKQFFLIVLSELARQDDPILYRNEARKISSHIEELHIPDPCLYYLKIIDYITKVVTTAHFGDIAANPSTKIEKQLEAIAKNVLDLSIYSLSKPMQKYLFDYTLGDLVARI
jgi:hypothetical protein